ncbi:hypothetical protein AK812_SmicGene38683 [Symbiodinium microadriaticum]|uniref:Uncharacterized protein n=1 Tax=Symbiodinium microadriaticum TaxID=2951 RepID=A0A1Q9CD53_SYMMI|nr:hypothetical protein AK812_SmicGene38683 [Symbiodinium microadriaticum]
MLPCSGTIGLAGYGVTTFDGVYSALRDFLRADASQSEIKTFERLSFAMHADYDRVASWCPAVTPVALVAAAFSIILRMFPVASADTPQGLLQPWMGEARSSMNMALDVFNDHASDVPGSSAMVRNLLQTARSKFDDIAIVLRDAGLEPWFGGSWKGPTRAWVRSPGLLRYFKCFNPRQYLYLPVPSSDPRNPQSFSYDVHLWPARREMRGRKAVGQILGPGAIYFPVAGTLIGLMRHGRTVGWLTEGKIDVVDRDVDLYLVLPSAKAYLAFCFAMTQSLRRAGWLGCSLKWRQDWSQTTLPQVDEFFDFRRSFTLQCHLLGDQGDSLLEIKWLVPVISVPSPCPRNLTDALLPSFLENPHFDAVSCCGGVQLMPENMNVSSVPGNVAITTGPIYCPGQTEWPSGRSKSTENLRLTQGLTDADVQVLVSRMLEMRAEEPTADSCKDISPFNAKGWPKAQKRLPQTW